MSIPKAAVGAIVSNIILLVLAITAVGLRFTARLKSSASFKIDDWTILACLICAIGLCVSSVWAHFNGIKGAHVELMSYDEWVVFRKVLFSDIIICHFVYGLIKASVVLFYKRIFKNSHAFTLSANIILAANSLFMISAFLLIIFCSRNVTTFWTISPMLDSTQYVIPLPPILVSMAVIDICLDIAILTLPMPFIKNLNLQTRKKVSVAAIFLLGGFCLVASIIRLYYVRSLVTYKGSDGDRMLFLNNNNDLWAIIEANASIVTASLPTLGPIFRGNRSIEALVGSVRSLFSIRSKSSSKLSDPGFSASGNVGDTPASERKQAWYELSTKGSFPSTVTKAKHEDVETGSSRSDAIMVKQTFSTHSGHS